MLRPAVRVQLDEDVDRLLKPFFASEFEVFAARGLVHVAAKYVIHPKLDRSRWQGSVILEQIMRAFLAVFVLMTSIVTIPAGAAGLEFGYELKQALDFSETYEKTQQPALGFMAGMYHGYVLGVAYATNGDVWCPPPNTTNGQLKAVVAKYLKENPGKWNESALVLVFIALKQNFPCKK